MLKQATNAEAERLAAARYLRLSTFQESGAAAHERLRIATEGGYLLAVLDAGAREVPRLLAQRQVSLAPCDFGGNLQGDPVEAIGTVLLDPLLVDRAQALLIKKYRFAGRLVALLSRLRRRSQIVVAFEVIGS